MKRKFRLTKSTDFKRVRRLGKSYAHPLVVLVWHPNDVGSTRLGISAGRSVGNAIIRSRTKRQLREIVRPLIPAIQPGWDIILLARGSSAKAPYPEIRTAVYRLMKRADLLIEMNLKEANIG